VHVSNTGGLKWEVVTITLRFDMSLTGGMDHEESVMMPKGRWVLATTRSLNIARIAT
jgi:hypothetical protein